MSEITEKDILNNIIKVIKFYYEKSDNNINNSINEIRDNIFVSINKLNNTYFIENEYIVKKYIEIINNFNKNSDEKSNEIIEFIYFLQSKLDNICDHEWVLDSIDITPDISENICYCDICKITKI